jgi:hypothetical protein
MNAPTRHRTPAHPLPTDPALWLWAAVALVALVPLGHAVAAAL